MHNEIHNVMKPCEAWPSQVFHVVGNHLKCLTRLKVIKGKAGKGHILFLTRPQGAHQKPKGQVPFSRGLVRRLVPLHYVHAISSTYHYVSVFYGTLFLFNHKNNGL